MEQLINSDKNELFENIRDAALNGNKNELAKLLNYFIFTKEDAFYFNSLNSTLLRLYDLQKQKKNNENINDIVNNARPPYFGKIKQVSNIASKMG